jgi:hypothetical protein
MPVTGTEVLAHGGRTQLIARCVPTSHQANESLEDLPGPHLGPRCPGLDLNRQHHMSVGIGELIVDSVRCPLAVTRQALHVDRYHARARFLKGIHQSLKRAQVLVAQAPCRATTAT